MRQQALNPGGFGGSGLRKPFQVIPWQEDFLSGLLCLALNQTEGGARDLSNILFVFPHARPARYLERLIRLDPNIAKPCLLPEMLPVHSLFQKMRDDFLTPAVEVGKLDQVGLLLDCVRAEQAERPGGISALPAGDAQAFFPWGVRLANLFEDCFIHGVTPTNFLHLEGELAEYAAALLGRLSSLHQRYLAALAERNWTTSGLTAFQIAEQVRQHGAPGKLADGRVIFIAGFYSPTGSEDALFRNLWERYGATVVLHADPALALGGGAHWSCSGLEAWRAKWSTVFELYGNAAVAGKKPKISFYSGYDVHSQLAALRETLLSEDLPPEKQTDDQTGKGEFESSTAIILPDADLLLPTLHHIHDRDLNISMGYPLDKTALSRLVENVMVLQENRRQGGYYWKDCIRLIRHPYLKMLEVKPDATTSEHDRATGKAWRDYLHRLEKELRAGRRYPDLPALMEQAALATEVETVRAASRELADILLRSWERLDNLRELSTALERLCAILVEKGESLWPRFPIDAECLYRFMQSLIPQLRLSALREEQLPVRTLFTILRQMLREERVPFDAFPLTALQIMGLLESRLLSFKRVFILEATDDLLPGGAQNDPLLPDSLRQELRLPDIFRKQRMTAYYFYRLLAGAEEAHLFWEEGVETQGLQDGKKLRSRFIEELLWSEEQKLGRLLNAAPQITSAPAGETSASPLTQLTCAPGPAETLDRQVAVSPAIRQMLEARVFGHGRKLSAGKINAFLTCPLAFYFREAAGILPVAEVAEADDPSETGQLLHEVFAGHYGRKLGRELRAKEQSLTELVNNFQRLLQDNPVIAAFPQDAQAALRRITPLRLARYLDNQPPTTRIMALETEAEARLETPDGSVFSLTGRIDRIDEREIEEVQEVEWEEDMSRNGREITEEPQTRRKGLVVLDYKTGRLSPPAKGFWFDESLWRDLRRASAAPEETDAILQRLSEGLNSNIQLPLYIYLLRHGRLERSQGNVSLELTDTRPVSNAAWVELRADGKESALFEDMTREQLTEILDVKIPDLLAFILMAMKNTPVFRARRGGHCAWCPYADMCGRLR